ncbi:TlpA family protein disulfide reductase, partial [Chitinophaga sp.]|uniref:TlpA family protein disulfide reductase n=2 Tax=Chitinophaga TaxID=79328 RepID=UPI002FDC8135
MRSITTKITIAALLFLYPLATAAQSDVPVLHAGTINVSGEVTIPEKLRKDSTWLHLTIPQVFTGEYKVYRALLDRNGRFQLKVNTTTNMVRGIAGTDINQESIITILLKTGTENKITFGYDEEGTVNKARVSEFPAFTEDDLLFSQRKFDDVIAYKSGKQREVLFDKPFSSYVNYANNVIADRRFLLDKPPFVSDRMKDILFREYSLALIFTHVFYYRSEMVSNYKYFHAGVLPDSAVIQTPVRQDYAFLKTLDLRNPLYLMNYTYPAFAREMLQNETLNLPPVGEMPVRDWLAQVKSLLRPLLGFDEGQFYDILAGNAFGLQFEQEVKPLTSVQEENIKKYYKGSDMQKILLRRNQEIVERARLKDAVVVRPTPAVSPDSLMSAIISRYKGKTVVVDFWATWCAPCLEAIEESRSLKKELAGKDVVFIYISNPSSPKKQWEQHIQGIGGEQYYLTRGEWEHIMDTHNFSGIPTYLVYDKQGALKLQMTGYPGNDDMQKLIMDIRDGKVPGNVRLED